jgi:hypothetical protein
METGYERDRVFKINLQVENIRENLKAYVCIREGILKAKR